MCVCPCTPLGIRPERASTRGGGATWSEVVKGFAVVQVVAGRVQRGAPARLPCPKRPAPRRPKGGFSQQPGRPTPAGLPPHGCAATEPKESWRGRGRRPPDLLPLNSRGAPPPPARFLAGWSALAGSSVPLLAEAALACWGLAAFGGRRDSGPGCRLGVSCVTCCVRRLHHGSARSELGGWLAFLRGGARLPLRRRVLQGGGWLNGLGHYEAAWRCCRGSVRFESGARPLLHGLRSCWALRVVGGWLVLLGVRAARGGVPSDDR